MAARLLRYSLYPVGIDYDDVLERLAVPGRPKVYIIRNSRLDPMYEQVRNKLFPIAGRSLESLVRTQGIGDLYRIYLELAATVWTSISRTSPRTSRKSPKGNSIRST